MKRCAFSVIELLVVIVIILLVTALLLPVFSSVKGRAKEEPCRSNLRQLYTAWSLYTADNNENWPYTLDEFASQPSTRPVLKCVADMWEGANRRYSRDVGHPVSYFYLMPIPQFRKDLIDADPNHGILYCVAHGARSNLGQSDDPVDGTTGTVLKVNLDGSVRAEKVRHMCSPPGPNGHIRGRPEWTLLTNMRPCPKQWCLGATVPCD